MTILLSQANSFRIPLANESVQCCVTSSPYWGLRDYGLPPIVLGGKAGCRHVWGQKKIIKTHPQRDSSGGFIGNSVDSRGLQSWTQGASFQTSQGQFCQLCGAWLGCLGLEPTPELYVEHLVQVFREVRRVLRSDGVLWLNLGDSYSGSWGNYGAREGKQRSRISERWHRPAYEDERKGWDGLPPTANVPGLKPKDLVGIPWRVAFALQADGWWLRSDVIWCLSGGTRVYAKTQKGEMPMTIKDMVRLDPSTVQLWNGEKWVRTLGWSESPRPNNPIEIELRSGERIGCTPEHQWPTQRGLVKAKDLQIGDIVKRCRLPQPIGCDHPQFIPEDIGWFVGLYLAEGSRSGDCIQISSHVSEEDRFLRLQAIAEAYGGTCRRHILEGNAATINLYGKMLNAILDMYISGRTAKDKHLTTACWRRTNAFLWEVLGGYLDGDGHYDQKNDRWRLGFTRNYSLEADLRTLCARLGVQLRLKLSTTSFQHGERKSFRGEIRFTPSNHHNAKDDGEIVRIGRSRARKFWDIGVEGESHLFALASSVLTHNSKPNCMPESVRDRPTKSHEYLFLLTKSARYYYDQDAIREPLIYPNRTYAPADDHKTKLLSEQGNRTTGGLHDGRETYANPAGRNKRTVWEIPTSPYPGAHFATFPPALVEPCIKAGTSERGCCPVCGAPWERVVEKHDRGFADRTFRSPHETSTDWNTNATGKTTLAKVIENETVGWRATCNHEAEPVPCTVLDPFVGSGTTLLVARALGRHSIGLDLSLSYLTEQARTRLELDKLEDWHNGRQAEATWYDLPLFGGKEPTP